MNEQNTIMIITESYEELQLKSGLPSLPQLVRKPMMIEEETLQKNLNDFLNSMFRIISKVKTESRDFEIEQISLSLVITTEGKVAIGVVGAEMSQQTGMGFVIKRKPSKKVNSSESGRLELGS